MACRELQRLRRLWRMTSVFPQYRCASFRTNYGIIGVFQHEHAIRNSNTQRATGTSFTNDSCYNLSSQDHHFTQINRYGLRNVPLFGTYSRVGPRQINERDHGKNKFFRKPHEAKGLSISLGMPTPKIAANVFLRISSFLMRHNHTAKLADCSEPAGHRLIVTKKAISMKLQKTRECSFEIIESKGARSVASNLNSLPGSELIVNLALGLLDFLLHRADFPIDIDRVRF